MSNKLTPKQESKHAQLQTSYPFFARYALKVRGKDGQIVPFVFNTAQEYLHQRVEAQRKKIGKVRLLVLKGRQQGCSTYIAGRFYHRTTRNSGRATFILSHEADTTEKLFQMVERFHENCPPPLKPPTDIANRRRMIFAGLNSEYFVGTAGNKDVGRGGTVQFFHGSEVAFWENTDGITTGVMQSVPDLPDTEIFLESTANGMGNYFYQQCMQAMQGKGEYELVFIPWYWQSEYRKGAPSDLIRSVEEEKLVELYGLDNDQIYWRRMKIVALGSEWKFKQEYPCNAIEAFQTSGDSLINPERVMVARKSTITDVNAPKILGVDPGRNKDRSVLVDRQGRHIRWYRIYDRKETAGRDSEWEMRLAGIVANLINCEAYDKVFIDCTKSWGTYDRLHEQGYGDIVSAVVFSEGAIENDIYLNKRVEIWCNMELWFGGDVRVPDDDAFQADICSMPGRKETSSGLTKLESKDNIIKVYGQSNDIGDAAACTFAYPVKRSSLAIPARQVARSEHKSSSLTTLQRFRRAQQQSSSSSSLASTFSRR